VSTASEFSCCDIILNSSRATRVSAAAAAAVLIFYRCCWRLNRVVDRYYRTNTSSNTLFRPPYLLESASNLVHPLFTLLVRFNSPHLFFRFFTMEEVQAQIQALRQQFADELARRDSQINALSSTITNQQGTITSLQATLASLLNASSPSSKRPKRQLPDPPKFDGTQSRYDT